MLRKSPRIRPQYDGRRQEADVAGQRAEIADVVGQALQLQRDAAQRLRARGVFWHFASASITWQ